MYDGTQNTPYTFLDTLKPRLSPRYLIFTDDGIGNIWLC